MTDAFHEDTTTIRWSRLRPALIETAMREALEMAQRQIDAIGDLDPPGLTFANTFLAFEEAGECVGRPWGRINHLDSVCNSPELREAMNAMLPEVTAFFADVYLNDNLWRTLRVFADSPAHSELSAVEKRFVEETLEDFRESGAGLPEEKQERLRAIERELAEITQSFSEHVLDATNAWDLVITDETELAGLPDVAKEGARVSALEKGHGTETSPQWRFTLQAPSYVPVLEYVENDPLRRKIWTALSMIGRQAPHDNRPLIPKILKLRREKAELLDRTHFADLILARRMAGSGGKALNFIHDLHDRIKDTFRSEIDALEAFKAEKTGKSPAPLEPWQLNYWSEQLRREQYDFDGEELRSFFPIQAVINGMFDLASELFGVRIEERPTEFVGEDYPLDESTDSGAVEVWHTEVRFYELFDANSDELLGAFYADWHPRESKRSGAWMNHFRTGEPGGEKPREPHVGLICGNLTPPGEDRPALLSHDEVQTIFHEFGHLLHHLLGDVPVKSLNGIHVVWDFVELPSQIMENFCWEEAGLSRFARHHESGEPLPGTLLEKMRRARNFQAAMKTMRQLSFGKMDLELHLLGDPENEDLDARIENWLKEYLVPTRTPRPNNSCAFLHLFSSPTGYAAGYYSYKWAEVLDADAFTRFRDAGVVSPEVGREFRAKILSQGKARDAADLFRDFMGRDPEIDALLIREGLRVSP